MAHLEDASDEWRHLRGSRMVMISELVLGYKGVYRESEIGRRVLRHRFTILGQF